MLVPLTEEVEEGFVMKGKKQQEKAIVIMVDCFKCWAPFLSSGLEMAQHPPSPSPNLFNITSKQKKTLLNTRLLAHVALKGGVSWVQADGALEPDHPGPPCP